MNTKFMHDDELYSAFQSPDPIQEQAINNDDSSFDASFNNGSQTQNIFNSQDRQNSAHKKDHSIISSNTLMNIQQYEEQHLVEIRYRLEEEMIKNEKLERKLRTVEFDNMIKTNEFTRKIQDLELKNSNLTKQIQEQDRLFSKSGDESQIRNKNQMTGDKTGSVNNLQNEKFVMEMESKLIQYENEILSLKERENELLGQINTMRSENFELRLKTERFSFFATKENNQSSPNQHSARKTYNQFKSLTPMRMTSGTQLQQIKSSENVQKNTASIINMNGHPSIINNAYQQQQQQRFTLSNMNQLSARVSVISGINSHVKINNENVNLDQLNDINEACELILQINAEKDQLEQDFHSLKDKAINQIIDKEKQIIDLIKFHEEQIDEMKQESSRLQLELKNIQRIDRNRDEKDNQSNVKFDREITQLKTDLTYSEEKYEKLHQKYLEERRQQENEIAFLQDKYQKDIQYYESKLEKQKDRTRVYKEEMDKMKSKLMQTQDFKQEIIKELEDQEQRLREADNEKLQLEKDFLYKIEMKNQIIQDKTQRIQQLQDQLFHFEDDMKKVQSEDNHTFHIELNNLNDDLTKSKRKLEEQLIELETIRAKSFKQEDQITELNNKKKMLNEIIQGMQKHKKDIEENYHQKIENLQNQINQGGAQFMQQIQALKTHIEFLENGGSGFMMGNSLKNEMQDVQECMEEEEGTSSSDKFLATRNSSQYNEGNYATVTFNTQSTYNNLTPKENKQFFVQQNAQPQKQAQTNGLSLMDELCDNDMPDQQRYSSVQGVSQAFNGFKRQSAFGMSPRQSTLSNSQFYNYQANNGFDDQYRNSYMSPSNRPSILVQQKVIDSQRPTITDTNQPITPASNKYQSNIFKLKLKKGLSEDVEDQNVQQVNKELDLLKKQKEIDSQRISELEGLLFMRETDIDILKAQVEQMQIQSNEKEDDLDQFQDQLELCQKDINSLKSSKDEMTDDFKHQLQTYQEQYKQSFKELQSLRKQNLQMKYQTQNHTQQLQFSQTNLTQENQQLKRKLRGLEYQNEELLEQLISQKQQYSSEKNHLRIQLCSVEDSLIQSKLGHAKVNMEKDLIGLKYKTIIKQNLELKDLIFQAQNKRTTNGSNNSNGNDKRDSDLDKSRDSNKTKQKKIMDWNLNFS